MRIYSNTEDDELVEEKEDTTPKIVDVKADILSALENQINSELYNSNLYNYISNFYFHFGLKELADFFKGHAREEAEHAELIEGFLRDRGYKLHSYSMTPVKEVMEDGNFKKPLKIFQKAEDETTKTFYRLYAQAKSENDLLALDFINMMIREQLEEMELAKTVNQIAELSTDWLAIQDAIAHLNVHK